MAHSKIKQVLVEWFGVTKKAAIHLQDPVHRRSFQIYLNLLPLTGVKKVGGEGLSFNGHSLCIRLHEVSLVGCFFLAKREKIAI